ncbi:ArsR/SmtB family transcription factor [Devosia aurantiaca]|uniref:Winged helix-turn-helix transcriptional regulator n=1 Tax=Devosia aurantiaca TaxID=2714858 RepID=A0A6M1SUT4_9HYPH|nr:winged helix-turn-helix domain-containing protein [Devosia aurantiaca]NGP18885.1 winged helix-turn-helix transcriptional regulator [Devosia aurantiaca]
MTDDEAKVILEALGDKSRFDIFRKVCGRSGLTASDLSAGKAASTNSHHLAKLEKVGLLTATRAGKTKHYVADSDRLFALAAWMNTCAEDAVFAKLDQDLLNSADEG